MAIVASFNNIKIELRCEMKLILFDMNAKLCQAWRKNFKDTDVVIINDAFSNVKEEYDCVVSPGNSFGIMSGGFNGSVA